MLKMFPLYKRQENSACLTNVSLKVLKLWYSRFQLLLLRTVSMKIQGPSKSDGAGKTDKAKKKGKSDSTFGDMVAGAAQELKQAAATQSIARVDALLSVQATESATERATKRRMRDRGDKVLRQLDHIRLGILTGNLTLGQVLDVADVVASHRENINDPELTAVLDEIDLRAQIEIAKMKKAMNG